jgi:recombination protein RecA
MQALRQHAGTVERLREQIRKLQAAPRQFLAQLKTGLAAFDALMPSGGLPLGHAVELCGEPASGRTSLALRILAAATRERRLAAYVDAPAELYPPAAAALGVSLERLLIVRPKTAPDAVWSALQLARSGAFAAVVLDLTHTGLRLALPQSKKLADAAVHGGALLTLLTPPQAPADGMTRFFVQAEDGQTVRVETLRSRHGGAGRCARLEWDALLGRSVPRTHLEAVRPVSLVLPRFVRSRSSEVRNGPCGLYASRPGRDTTFPSLAESLGAR